MAGATRPEVAIDEPSDTESVRRTLAGERAAFAVLVRRHAAIATRTAAVLGAGPDTDDVVQEAFVKAYRALGTFRHESPFRPWLLRIVANETRNAQRSRGRRSARERAAEIDPLPRLAGPADPADLPRLALSDEALRARLLELPEPQRAVLACRFLLDLDEDQTATVLGVARGTVKSRASRALDRLRRDWPAAADPQPEARHG